MKFNIWRYVFPRIAMPLSKINLKDQKEDISVITNSYHIFNPIFAFVLTWLNIVAVVVLT